MKSNKCPSIRAFRAEIWKQYHNHGRKLSWRETQDPYHIIVSEIMLQQTQVKRVVQKFPEFIAKFPNFATLAAASLSEIYPIWSGMGYNRRALALKKIAERVTNEFHGTVPHDPEILVTLPGIGTATAASVAAFAFNSPTVFIETNIRTVFLHFFFRGKIGVDDRQIMPLVAATVDKKNPREWYYALMDYGTRLKSEFPNPSRASATHRPQSKFEGSQRQVRGAVLRALAEGPKGIDAIARVTKFPRTKIASSISDLSREGLICTQGRLLRIP